MPLDASQFLLPGFGGDPGQGLSNLANTIYSRNMQRERLQLAKEGRRQEAGNFLKGYLDPKQYLTGTAYDPVVNTSLQAALAKGSALAQQGADIPTLLTALGPDMLNVSNYTSKAQVINKQLKDGIAQMERNGIKGVDFERVYNRAQRAAFHAIDPKTGQESLKHPDDISTATDYIQQAIQEHPDEVMTGGDMEAYAKSQATQKSLRDIQQYDAGGKKTSSRVHLIAPQSFVPEVDDNGVTTAMVPKHEVATDGGQPLMHTFIDASGKETKAPVRLLDEGEFDNMVQSKPLIANYLMGQVKKHWPEYEGGAPYDPNSAEAKRVARAYAYDELKRHSTTAIENVEIQGKPSAAQVQLHVFGGREQQARDRAFGAAEGKAQAGDEGLTPAKPLNAVETTNKIFNNDPDYLTGEAKTIKVGGKEHHAIDVTSAYQGGVLRFGHGENQTYGKVYYDPKDRTLITEDKEGKQEAHSESEMGDFMKKIAGPNKLNAYAVDRLQARGGYKNGRYGKPADASGVTNAIDQQVSAARTAKVSKAVDELATNGKGSGLKGVQSPIGEITDAGETGYFSTGKYYIDAKGADGKTVTRKFKNKEELQAFLQQGAAVQPAPAVTKPSTAKPKAILD